jgi:hypothetical protein
MCRADILNDHVPNTIDTVRALQKRTCQTSRDDLRHVLMLGDCEHLGLFQSAELGKVKRWYLGLRYE